MNCNMTVEEAIKILLSYPSNAEIILNYYDFYGEKNTELLFSYNPISEKVYASPGKDIRYHDDYYDDDDEYYEE